MRSDSDLTVKAIRVALPLAKPMLMAGTRIETAENVLVRIEAADDTVGWGEATSAPTMTGDLAESLVAAVRHLTPLLIEQDARMHALLARRCLNAMHGNGGANTAIDMALLDLVGRQMDMPTIEFLGGPLRDTVTPMWLLGNPSVVDDLEEAKAKRAAGFIFFKLKVGIKPVAEEIGAAALLRKEPGPDVLLCADANAGLELSRALNSYTEQVISICSISSSRSAPRILPACRRLPRSGRCRSAPTKASPARPKCSPTTGRAR